MARLPRLIALALPTVLLSSAIVLAQERPTAPDGPTAPRYFEVVRAELRRLELDPICEADGRARGTCRFEIRSRTGEERWPVEVVVSDATRSVYLAVLRLGRIDPDADAADAALRRLAEANWALSGAQLEWSPRDGQVRLSATQRTESNFDRAAFRVLVRLLMAEAERHGPAIERW